MACQKLMLEIFILIFRARRVVLAPDSRLGQKIKIAMDQTIKTNAFLKNFPRGSKGSPVGPGGRRGAFIARKRSPRPKKLIYRGPDARFWQENIKKKLYQRDPN